MNIKRRDFIRAGGMLAIVGGGAAVADAAGVSAAAPAGAVRVSQDDILHPIAHLHARLLRVIHVERRQSPVRLMDPALFI